MGAAGRVLKAPSAPIRFRLSRRFLIVHLDKLPDGFT